LSLFSAFNNKDENKDSDNAIYRPYRQQIKFEADNIVNLESSRYHDI